VGILVLPLVSKVGNRAIYSLSPTTVVAPATDIEIVVKSESKREWLGGGWSEGPGSVFILCASAPLL